MKTPCYYPNYEYPNEFIVGEHKWGKDNFCIICGEKRKEEDGETCKKEENNGDV